MIQPIPGFFVPLLDLSQCNQAIDFAFAIAPLLSVPLHRLGAQQGFIIALLTPLCLG